MGFSIIAPRAPNLDECDFYHSQMLPTGEVRGQWDLRQATEDYLGKVDFSGQTVLEIGPASGFLSFHIEASGGAVTCIEPPLSHLWDVVPFSGFDTDSWRRGFSSQIRRIRNSFWYCHTLLRSHVRMIETNPYDIPAEVGCHDIGILASVLLHAREPFSLLESVGRRVTRTIIVTECHYPALGPEAICRFMPHLGVPQVDTWWQFTPQFFVSALGLLGFPEARVHFHQQKCEQRENLVSMFTVVASRRGLGAC